VSAGFFVNARANRTIIAFAVLISSMAASPDGGTTDFPRPPEIQEAIGFWTRIYSDIDTQSGLIHDNRSLNIVYESFPLPRHASPKRQHRMIRKRVRHYQRLLNRIANKAEAQLNDEERRVKRLWGPHISASQLKKAADRVRFQRGQSDRMRTGLERAATYEHRIRAILRDKGVPEALAALPHVESSYNPNVRSKAGAAGLWQIMPATGRRYLRVNNVVDERLDPYKATKAAAQLLRHNYSVLKSWPLAITAYNHGLSGVRRAVRKTGTGDIGKIIQNYNGRAFRFASRNFYPAFLAAYDVSARHRAKTGQKASQSDVPAVVLNAYLPAGAVAEGLEVDRTELRRLNPDLTPSVWSGEKRIPKSYALRIPGNSPPEPLRARVRALEKQSGYPAQIPDRLYRVRTGDSLGAIAQRYDTSVGTLVAMNSLRSRHRINAGQLLRIPKPAGTRVGDASSLEGEQEDTQGTSGRTAAAQPPPQAATASHAPRSPQATAGQGSRGDTTAMPIGAQNVEDDEATSGGDGTVVTAQSDLAADPADYLVAEDGTIEVQVGETLGHYAHWLGISTRSLRTVNGMRRSQHVIVGKRLRLGPTTTDTGTFERKRKAFHAGIQNRFFERHLITDVKTHPLSNGDNLWELSTKTYRVPLWLLRQYNPDLTFGSVLSLSGSIRIPVVEINGDSALSTPSAPVASPAGLARLD